MAYAVAPLPRVRIDSRLYRDDGQTWAGFHAISGAIPEELPRNTEVTVYDPVEGLEGRGWVASRDFDRDRIYLAVDWGSLAEPEAEPPAWIVALVGAVFTLARWVFAFAGEFRQGFRHGRCRKDGHKPSRLMVEQGMQQCGRCGEVIPVGEPESVGTA